MLPAICVIRGELSNRRGKTAVPVYGNASRWTERVTQKCYGIVFALCFIPLFIFICLCKSYYAGWQNFEMSY
jgi:hypothetical protein